MNLSRPENLADRIKILRRLNDFTQEALAAAVGVSATCVVDWEAGRYRPTEANLARLADILDPTGSSDWLRPDEVAS